MNPMWGVGVLIFALGFVIAVGSTAYGLLTEPLVQDFFSQGGWSDK